MEFLRKELHKPLPSSITPNNSNTTSNNINSPTSNNTTSNNTNTYTTVNSNNPTFSNVSTNTKNQIDFPPPAQSLSNNFSGFNLREQNTNSTPLISKNLFGNSQPFPFVPPSLPNHDTIFCRNTNSTNGPAFSFNLDSILVIHFCLMSGL